MEVRFRVVHRRPIANIGARRPTPKAYAAGCTFTGELKPGLRETSNTSNAIFDLRYSAKNAKYVPRWCIFWSEISSETI